jgi:hypothetical protein
MASSFMSFQSHTKRRTTFGRTYLDEWSACCRDPYLRTHNTHNRKTSMPPAGYEPTISAGERPQELRLALCSHRDRPLHVYPKFFLQGEVNVDELLIYVSEFMLETKHETEILRNLTTWNYDTLKCVSFISFFSCPSLISVSPSQWPFDLSFRIERISHLV